MSPDSLAALNLTTSRSSPRRVLIFCPNLVGDAVMATPTLRALRQSWPEARLFGVAKPVVAATLKGLHELDEWFVFNPQAGFRATLGLIRSLRAQQFDLAVLLPNSLRSALLAWLSGARRRVGYNRGGRQVVPWLLTDRLDPPRDPATQRFTPTPIVGYYLRLAEALGCPRGSTRLSLMVEAHDQAALERVLSRLNLGSSERRLVVFNTGGAFGPAKSWPSARFAALGRRLVETNDGRCDVLVMCGPAEREEAQAIVRQAAHPRVRSLDEGGEPLGIGLSKACVRRADLLVTTDSGPRHFAAALNRPVLTLFGPTGITWTVTQHPLAWHLYQPQPCQPCQQRVCPLGHHRCMTELSVDAVYRVCQRVLGWREPPTTVRPHGRDRPFLPILSGEPPTTLERTTSIQTAVFSGGVHLADRNAEGRPPQ